MKKVGVIAAALMLGFGGIASARYRQADPSGPAGGINPYVYVDADPLLFIDPFGLEKLILFPIGTPEYAAAFQAADKSGLLTVFGHGNERIIGPTPDGRDGLVPSSLAELIRMYPLYKPGMPVELMTCDAASGPRPYAKQLADLLNTAVTGYGGKVVFVPMTPLTPAVAAPLPFVPRQTYGR